MTNRSIGILGLGSVLMGDDAAGPRLVRRLESRWHLPEAVELVDVGTPGPDLFHYLEGWWAVIVADTVHASAPPGAVRCYRKPDLEHLPPRPRLSPHDPDLVRALLTAELAGTAPGELLVVGVVPERVELGTELSLPVERALAEMEERVIDELRRLGAEPRRRRQPRRDGSWWREGPVGEDVATGNPAGGSPYSS